MKTTHWLLTIGCVLILVSFAFGDDAKELKQESIHPGMPWEDALEILERHGVRESREYPALGFDPGDRPTFVETQFEIAEGIRIWFTRDSEQDVRTIQLHVYPTAPRFKPSYRTLNCQSISFFKDRSYRVHIAGGAESPAD